MSCSVCQEKLSYDTQSSSASASLSSGSTPNAGCDGQSKVLALCCGHVYHQACICDWFKQSRKKTCPICRRAQKGTPLELFLHDDSSGDASRETVGRLNDLVTENGKLREKIKALGESVSSVQEENRRLEKKQEELQIRYSVREVEFLKEARDTAQLKSQLNAAKGLSSAWEMRISELDSALAGKDAKIAQLQQSIQETTQSSMGVATKLQSLQGQYSELSMKYTARDLEYIAEATKSQKLLQEAMAAIDRLTKLEHKIAELSRDSDCKSSCTDTSSDCEATETKVHELREQYTSGQTLRGAGAALATSEFICNLMWVACAVDRVSAFPANHKPWNCCCDDIITTHQVQSYL
ncbi:hypothetical protein GQ54DRAFT_341840 [Martensiomyces pterosporus]|nr:hypothetical protein GQ54DRAFT_341840 [Martensiomyces pterosporus]